MKRPLVTRTLAKSSMAKSTDLYSHPLLIPSTLRALELRFVRPERLDVIDNGTHRPSGYNRFTPIPSRARPITQDSLRGATFPNSSTTDRTMIVLLSPFSSMCRTLLDRCRHTALSMIPPASGRRVDVSSHSRAGIDQMTQSGVPRGPSNASRRSHFFVCLMAYICPVAARAPACHFIRQSTFIAFVRLHRQTAHLTSTHQRPATRCAPLFSLFPTVCRSRALLQPHALEYHAPIDSLSRPLSWGPRNL